MGGRATGTTSRKVAYVKVDVLLEGSHEYTSEYTVVSPISTNSTSFSIKGDSGGPVFGERGEFVGIILGGSDGACMTDDGAAMLSYISPWMSIKRRIQVLSGLDLHVCPVERDKLSEDGFWVTE